MTDLDGMFRVPDHHTSIESAEAIAPIRTKLQGEIYDILCLRPMTDGELELLPQFRVYGPSTVRKRRSELYQAGRIEETGETRARMKVWKVKK